MSRQALSRESGVSKETIKRLENPANEIGALYETIEKLALALNVTVPSLRAGEVHA